MIYYLLKWLSKKTRKKKITNMIRIAEKELHSHSAAECTALYVLGTAVFENQTVPQKLTVFTTQQFSPHMLVLLPC